MTTGQLPIQLMRLLFHMALSSEPVMMKTQTKNENFHIVHGVSSLVEILYSSAPYQLLCLCLSGQKVKWETKLNGLSIDSLAARGSLFMDPSSDVDACKLYLPGILLMNLVSAFVVPL